MRPKPGACFMAPIGLYSAVAKRSGSWGERAAPSEAAPQWAQQNQRGAVRIGAVLGQSALLTRPSERVGPLEWEQIVGSHLAERTEPGKVAGGVLLVTVVSSVWAQEVSLLAPTILQRMRERGRTVRALRFRVAPVRSLRPPEAPAVVVRRAHLPAPVTRALEHVDDPGLRHAIAEAAAFSLGRKRR